MPNGLLGRIEQYGKDIYNRYAPQPTQTGPYGAPLDRELAAKKANIDQYLQAYPEAAAPAQAAPLHPGVIQDLLQYLPRMKGPKTSATRFNVQDEVPEG